MSKYAAGRRREYRAQRILEAAGYETIRAAASKGPVDIIALACGPVRLISVKSGTARPTAAEREALHHLKQSTHASVEVWRFPNRCREPLIEVL